MASLSRKNLSVVLAERPTRNIIPGKTFRQESVIAPTAADLEDGQILLQSLYLSLDPAMRAWIDDRPSYLPPVKIGEVMRGTVIGRVIASKSPKAKVGDLVTAFSGWREFAILSETEFDDPIKSLPPNGRVTDLLGVLGSTGLTAYFGLTKVADIKSGDTVVVSGAAGATGSVAGQIAKIMGAKVVGIAGSEEKVRWLVDDLHFDQALNYKDPEFAKRFEEATPDRIDVYWDNVGGEMLDLALARANLFARFVICGGISQYNNRSNVAGTKNIMSLVVQRIRMQGFLVFDYAAEHAAAREELSKWLADGKLKRKDTIVQGGLEAAEAALVNLFEGVNTGKLIIEF